MNKLLIASIPSLILSQALFTHAEELEKKLSEQEQSQSQRAYIHVHEPTKEQRLKSSELITQTPEEGEVVLGDKHNTQYFGAFLMGSQNQEFTGVLDTGSSNIWTPEKNCLSPACENKQKFDPELSQTFSTNDQELTDLRQSRRLI